MDGSAITKGVARMIDIASALYPSPKTLRVLDPP
jgi:hypothetical protein